MAIALCPSLKSKEVKAAKDLTPRAFRKLVARRGQFYTEVTQTPSTEKERKEIEKEIKFSAELVDGESNFLPAAFLRDGADLAHAVCRITVEKTPGRFSHGTGFLIGRDIIMTNNHVIENQEHANSAFAEFGFEERSESVITIQFLPDRLFITDKTLDFTIVACTVEGIEDLNHVPLLRNPATITRHEHVNIIQHPSGRPKEVSLQDNEVIRVKDLVIRYSTDTEPGSSGSPVFNNDWELVALHHAGADLGGGRAENEGIRISAIVNFLLSQPESSRPPLRDAISNILEYVEGVSPYLGFFDTAGLGSFTSEVEVPDFSGTPEFADIGFWNIEHFNDRVSDSRVYSVSDVVSNPDLLDRSAITLQASDIVRHLGITVDAARVTDILQRLGCAVEASDASWSVIPPVFRFDISREVDLIEEIARVYGYDKIPSRLRPMTPRIARKLETEVNDDVLRHLLVAKGYREAVTYSFVPLEVEQMLSPASKPIRLANPISEELAIMRSTLWSGLLPALVKNLNRQQSDVRLFETGLNFVKSDAGILQRKQLAGVITGSRQSEYWGGKAANVDFFDVKGDVESLLAEATQNTYDFAAAEHSALHPGQSAQISVNGNPVGWVGALHPRLEKAFGLSQSVFLFELDLAGVSEKSLPAYEKLSKFPSIRRDIALLVDKSVSFANIEKVLNDSQIEELISHRIFDVYEGEGVEVKQKSMALGLIFQDFSRTLEDADINSHVESIVQLLEKHTGAVLRS